MQSISGSSNFTYGIYSALPITAFSNLDYNDYFIDGVQPNVGYLAGNKATLASWQSATGKEGSGKDVDPLLISGTELHSQQPLLVAGIPIALVTTDHSGITRAAIPSIGAYELPQVTTSGASAIVSAGATLTGTVNGCNQGISTIFEYGLSNAYGSSFAATPAVVSGSVTTAISAVLTGLTPGTLYHYRATGIVGSAQYTGADMTFTTTTLIPENAAITGVVSNITDSCYNATNTITVAGGGNTFEVQDGGSAIFIAGSKILFYAGTSVQPGGYMHGYITLTNDYCSTVIVPMVAIKTGIEEMPVTSGNSLFKLYPNPTNGNFTLVQKSDNLFSNVKIVVYGMHEEIVITETLSGEKVHDFFFNNMASGLYFVKVVADGYVETQKLVKL